MSRIRDAAQCLLEERGFEVPECDFSDVLKTAAGLASSVQEQLASMPTFTASAPFISSLQDWRAPELVPQTQGYDGHQRQKEAIAETLVRQSIAHINRDALGSLAWRNVFEQAALEAARLLDHETRSGDVRGPLHGVPVGVKDMFDLKGKVAHFGSNMSDGWAPAVQDAAVISKLKDAGAIVLGVQHMAEFAMSPTGLNVNLGHGKNPWNPEHASGGSSSGAGMSVGAGHVSVAIGSDTGGSVRLPAGFCGATGLKPTQYAVSLEGVMPLAPNLDCVGPIGRTAQNCASAYFSMVSMPARAMALADLTQYPLELKVALPELKQNALISADMLKTLNDTVQVLRKLDVEIINVPMPDLDTLGKLASVVLATESTATHRQLLQHRADAYGRQVRRRLSRGLFVSSIDYYDALRLRASLLQTFMQQTLRGAHALLLPLAPDVAPLISDTVGVDESVLEARFSALSYWTRGINYLGLPALALPAGLGADNLPLAVQFIGAPFSETQLLVLGHHFQQQTAWHQRIPEAGVSPITR